MNRMEVPRRRTASFPMRAAILVFGGSSPACRLVSVAQQKSPLGSGLWIVAMGVGLEGFRLAGQLLQEAIDHDIDLVGCLIIALQNGLANLIHLVLPNFGEL